MRALRAISFVAVLAAPYALGGESNDGPTGQGALQAAPQPGGPTTFGDPLQATDTTAIYHETDLVVHDSTGNIPFTRTYFGNPWAFAFNQHLTYASPPFGPALSGDAASVNWVHNFYSFVVVKGNPDPINGDQTPCVARDMDGAMSVFPDCAPTGLNSLSNTPTMFTTASLDRPQEPRLWWDGTSAFTLIKPGQGRFHYGAKVNLRCGDVSHPTLTCDFYFLTSAERPEYPDTAGTPSQSATRFTVQYGTQGAPFIHSIVGADGETIDFVYDNTTGWMMGLLLTGKDGHQELIATYAYLAGGGLQTVTDANLQATVYDYTSGFKVTRASTLKSQKIYGTGIFGQDPFNVISDINLIRTTTVGVTQTVGQPPTATHYSLAGLSTGDNSGSTATRYNESRLAAGGLVNSVSTSCLGPACTPSNWGTPRQTIWNTIVPNVATTTQETDNIQLPIGYSKFAWALPPVGTGDKLKSPYGEHELRIQMNGAANPSGGGALRTVNYQYQYGGVLNSPSRAAEQLVTASTEMSTQSGLVTTLMRWDPAPQESGLNGTNRLRAVIRTGQSLIQAGDSFSFTTKNVATFYYTRYKCSNVTAQDPNIRTVEVHGPCFVADPNTSTDCDLPGITPVTQYFYYGVSGTDNDNRLQTVRRFSDVGGTTPPNCTSGRYLDTTYSNYDARGRALTVTDANGTRTDSVFGDERLMRTTVTPASGTPLVTNYGYDNGSDQLLTVTHPSGSADVACYRSGTTPNAGCVGGTGPTILLQWKARTTASTPQANVYTEKITYAYDANGKVSDEVTYWCGGGLCSDATATERQRKHFESDVGGNSTFARAGAQSQGAGASFVSLAGFDYLGQQIGTGLPFNIDQVSTPSADAFCPPSDKNCAQTTRDLLGRPTQVRAYPDPTHNPNGVSATNITYDSQGNVSQIMWGCDASQVCGATAQYSFDDFHNLAIVHGSWQGAAGNMYQHDAAGNVTSYKTASMGSGQSIGITFDNLSRVTATNSYVNAVATLLFQYDYDSPSLLVPFGCSPNLPVLPYAKGRLFHKKDSFGDSFYWYDGFGNVMKTKRMRIGASQCSAGDGSSEANPDSVFSYDPLGRLSTEKHPHGRNITYTYGTSGSGFEDRVVSISTYWNAAPRTIISGVLYEPYGGVMSYIARPTSAPTAWEKVEYLPGGGVSSPPANACSYSLGNPDESGRLRLLRVSRGAGCDGTCTWTPIYQRTFTWNTDQISSEATCVLGDSTTTQTLNYFATSGGKGYDNQLRLTHGSRPSNEFSTRGGPFYQRDYYWAPDGTSMTSQTDCYGFMPTVVAGGQLTALKSAGYVAGGPPACPSGMGGALYFWQEYFTYNADGRVTHYQANPMGTGYATDIVFDTTVDGEAALGGVYRAATVNGMRYDYYYDDVGRRRFKAEPLGATNEYFYSGTDLLEDRGAQTSSSDGLAPIDDYIWLAGRPVALVRSQLPVGKNGPATDSATDCTRDTEGYQPCGIFFPVVDLVGKPVVMLDPSSKIVGLGEYDPFGVLNRAQLIGTSSPVGAYGGATTQQLSQYHFVVGSGMVQRTRGRFAMIDIYPQKKGASLVGPPNSLLISGIGVGPKVTEWLTGGTSFVATFSFTSNPASYDGATFGAYEYQKYETGTSPTWLPLRFRGQYFDSETDLNENWNRFYQPRTGRYFAPDPLALAASPVSSIYAYAGDNPISNADPDGRQLDPASEMYLTAGSAGACANGSELGCDMLTYSAAIAAAQVAIGFAIAVAPAVAIALGVGGAPAVEESGAGGEIVSQASESVSTAMRGGGTPNWSLDIAKNAAGGMNYTFNGDITQDQVTPVVNGLVNGGAAEINILSGAHGQPAGGWQPSPGMFNEDIGAFGGLPGLTIYYTPNMSASQINGVLNSAGATIGAFCNSATCLAPYK